MVDITRRGVFGRKRPPVDECLVEEVNEKGETEIDRMVDGVEVEDLDEDDKEEAKQVPLGPMPIPPKPRSRGAMMSTIMSRARYMK